MKKLQAFHVNAIAKGNILGEPFGKETDGCVGAEIMMTNRPKMVVISLLAEPKDGISPLSVYRGEAQEYTDPLIFDLNVPVKWREEGRTWLPAVPDWKKEKNFANVVLFSGDLQFVDVQVSVVAREERLYLMIQKVYEGWIREQGKEIVFIPGAPEFARPGLDYRELWRSRGQALAMMGAIASQMSEALGCSLSMPEAAEWESAPKSTGREIIGRVAHFNPITDSGMALDAKGKEYQLLGRYLKGFESPVMVPAYGILVALKTAPRKPDFPRILAVECRPLTT